MYYLLLRVPQDLIVLRYTFSRSNPAQMSVIGCSKDHIEIKTMRKTQFVLPIVPELRVSL